ncbi:XRE family transcriptional regulator [Sinorhizobium meliloti]|nr:XRE family transcriptional regulator [Sinorhizobium meliloti]RVI33969.1 XRE family transcriptional regulator [Sinorhizobium meliloti]RVI45077.1 XRE family transcriptional regulator [Sinorhizobium meliloti]RVJ30154.1 XRE family transcriptional regulator [Sinorhizobium meliloti]RVK03059.1 XRE family transcriptional regulator [Sinorhizobium meliloti]
MKVLIKAGRDLLGMTQAELCEKAGVPLITLRRIEGKPDHAGLVSQETVSRVKAALEAQGVQFLEGGQLAAGPGVALKGARG